jgi:hypothetical protein
MFDESRFKESQVEYVIEMSSLENIDECIDKDDDNNSQRMGIDGKNKITWRSVLKVLRMWYSRCDGINILFPFRPTVAPTTFFVP